MIEFGSDFHSCDIDSLKTVNNWEYARTYACGRQAIDAIINHLHIKRIWVPAYFCYEVIAHILSKGIEVLFYDDYPLQKSRGNIIKSLAYQKGDALLRVNYFGLGDSEYNYNNIGAVVIEDHTHDLCSSWARNSKADWCIASLRKTLPIAAGGVLWSPKGNRLPEQMPASIECRNMATMRYEAMQLKKRYLLGTYDNKEEYRSLFIRSENMIEALDGSGIDPQTYQIISTLDITKWTELRKKNWQLALGLLEKNFVILRPQSQQDNPFSLIICCQSQPERESLRQYLINNRIYPAILWDIPKDSTFDSALQLSNRMLSIHCDARYNSEDIEHMCKIINAYYD